MKKLTTIFLIIICLNTLIIHQIFIKKSLEETDLSTEHILTESVIENEAFNVENYFNVLTLKEKYGNQLESELYLNTDIISYDDLRYLEVLHVGFDGQVHKGELIVHKSVADEVLHIFREIYDVGFPIEKMKVISQYNYSDIESMEDNNTSAFNFRMTTNGTHLSNHAFGLAIDINPKLNPYVTSSTVLPESATEFVDRNQFTIGIIKKDEAIYQIFTKYGWTWGGDWEQTKDYQHFEKIIN